MPNVNASMFHQVSNEIADLLARKNHDYGNSFDQLYEQFGDISTLIRLTDKLNRLKTLALGAEALVDESLDDVYLDMAGYCILTLVARHNIKNKEENVCSG